MVKIKKYHGSPSVHAKLDLIDVSTYLHNVYKFKSTCTIMKLVH